jgi:prepilin-type N-terminal cleavage/methylation domain-containing protein
MSSITLDPRPPHLRLGATLIELLCVLAIIGVLAGMLLGPAGRALKKARRLRDETEAPAHQDRLEQGMRKYANRHAEFACSNLEQLLLFAAPGAPTERWIRAHPFEFIPFRHDSPDDHLVLAVFPKGGTNPYLLLTKRELTVTP